MKNKDKKKIVLGLLPYWTPLIPPQGIASLKGYIEKHDYRVKTFDANVENRFGSIYRDYFGTLKKYVPPGNWGNFYNIGHDVLRNHMMAYFNRTAAGIAAPEYRELVKLLVYHTYYHRLDDRQIDSLDNLIHRFYSELETYILDLLEKEKPAVFGLTAHLGTLGSSLFAFKLAKENYPHLITAVGGSIFAGELPVTSPDFEFFLEQATYIDKVFIGESQELFLRFIEGKLPSGQRVFTPADNNGRRMDIAAADLPDISDFDLKQYPFMAAFGSQSCPHGCRFCSVSGFFGEYRQKSVAKIVDQLNELYKRHGSQVFHMTDSLLNPYITELAEELVKREMSMYLDAYLRVSAETGDPDKTLLWRQGGLYRARMGIETGSPRLLESMGKEITVEQSKAALRNLAAAGIKTTAYFVVGYPGETEEDFRQTLDFIEELRNDLWEMECNPFYYYYTGQPDAGEWERKRKLLYPENSGKLLISQTWIVDCEPTREERFSRMSRLAAHCNRLGIPNPYTADEIYKADVRWKHLHENAVPTLAEFNREHHITENKTVKRYIKAQSQYTLKDDFNF